MKYSLPLLFFLVFFSVIYGFGQCPSSVSYGDSDYLRKNGYSLATSYTFSLYPGYSDYTSRQIYSSSDYVFVAYAENGVKDLDLYILSADGTTTWGSDTDSNDGGAASVIYTPGYDKYVRIKVKNHSAYCGSCSYCVKVWVYYR